MQSAITAPTLDFVLTAQLAVAWAGEAGEEPRLGWWRTDMASEYGGEDLFRFLLPDSWRWAVLEAAREAARRRDEDLRRQTATPDALLTLFALGFETDERLSERLAHHKRTTADPREALPGLRITTAWNQSEFSAWLEGHGRPALTATPTGRLLKGAPPALFALVSDLLGALCPLPDAYPMPHYRRPA